jgi:hypothetical protein
MLIRAEIVHLWFLLVWLILTYVKAEPMPQSFWVRADLSDDEQTTI